MKNALLLCLLSAGCGTIVSLMICRTPTLETPSTAQDIAPPPVAPPTAPLPGDAVPVVTPAPMAAVPAATANWDLTPEERVNVAVYDGDNRGVVNISTEGVQGERIFMFEVPAPSKGEGSGSVIDRQGHILTNYHVIDGARQIQVTLFNGASYEATLVGGDPSTDTAVLHINAPTAVLFPIPLGSSSNLRVGQKVYAIGNPFGLERTLSTGIISSLNRSLPSRRNGRSIKSIIQIDAAINPGNSGGPLLDTHGRLIGMNTAIASKTGESAGVGFAIPINTISRVVPQLIANGRVIRPEAGILQVWQTDHGLLILRMAPNGPAERAGLHGVRVVREQKRQGPFVIETQRIDRAAADMIVAIDDKPVRTGDDFLDAIESKRPGDQVIMTVVRQGKTLQVPLRLEQGE
jgi:S1-C subfamily serine protease